MSILRKQIAACKLAVEVLERERRRLYAAGEHAWNSGVRKDVVDEDGITHVGFAFAEDGHAGYLKYSDAISEMQDMIESLTDADTHLTQLGLFEVNDGSESSD